MALLETSTDDGVLIELPAGTAKLVYSVSSRDGETSPELDRPSSLGDRADLNWRLTGALAMIIVMPSPIRVEDRDTQRRIRHRVRRVKHERQWSASSDSDQQLDAFPEDDQQWNALPDDDHGLGLDHQGRHDDEDSHNDPVEDDPMEDGSERPTGASY